MTTPVAQENRTVESCGPTRCVPELDADWGNLDAAGMAVVFKALGSPVRLRLLAVVQSAASGEACVCDFVDSVGLTQSTVSHHLAVLMDAGLVRRERRGTWAWYALVSERLDLVRDLLANPHSSAS